MGDSRSHHVFSHALRECCYIRVEIWAGDDASGLRVQKGQAKDARFWAEWRRGNQPKNKCKNPTAEMKRQRFALMTRNLIKFESGRGGCERAANVSS